MKLSLPTKLGITVIVVFGLLFTGMALWRPMKVRYYAAKLHSEDVKIRQNAARILLDLATEGPKDQGTNRPVFNYYTDRYDPKNVKKRMEVVDELCACGDKGKAVIKEIFRNWCCSPSQQVKIPAGALILENGTKVEIKSLWVDKYEVTIEKFHIFQMLGNYTIQSRPWSTRIYHSGPNDEPSFGYDNSDTIIFFLELSEWSCYPVNRMDEFDGQNYAAWLGMRLPTEYEWEYAARAGSTGKYCFGDNESLLGEYAWHKGNSKGQPHPIGQKKPNKWGLHDMCGNLSEWCLTLKEVQIGKSSKCLLEYGIRKGNNYFSNEGESTSTEFVPVHLTGFRCVRDVK